MEEDEEPEAFFVRVEYAIRNKRRWKVKRQLTIGMLSFGKLAVWADLDTVKYPQLPKHPQITNIFSGGGTEGDAQSYAEDYRIDDRPDADIPLIYDADSSQHSAIIDVFQGRNMVINGPPGTGKSQTITNLIAAALSIGKTVLFVSEKLAALEVVRHRLNQAELGHFCLELHSHKTQKKKFIEDIKDRLEQRFPAPPQFKDRLESLRRLRRDLANHAELMASKVGNALDLTIHEVFWACERRRAELGDLAVVAAQIELFDAPKWTLDNIRAGREQVEALADLWLEVRSAGQPHPWDGFRPRAFIPGNDIAISNILEKAKGHLSDLIGAAEELADLTADPEPRPIVGLLRTFELLQAISEPPTNLVQTILPALFTVVDPHGHESKLALSRLSDDLAEALEYRRIAHEVLHEGHELNVDLVAKLRERAESLLSPASMAVALERLSAWSQNIQERLSEFRAATVGVRFRWTAITAATTAKLANCLADLAELDIASHRIADLATTATEMAELCERLRRSWDVVRDIAKRRSLVFDDRPATIAALLKPSGIDGLVGEAPMDEAEIATMKSLLSSPMVPQFASLATIGTTIDRFRRLETEISESLVRCEEAVDRFDVRCVGPSSPENELRAILAIARNAPLAILKHRHSNLADRGASETISKVAHAIHQEAELRSELEGIFHIDAVPPTESLRAALMTFRRGGGFFKFLNNDWGQAKKTFNSVAKERRSRSATEFADLTSKLIAWIDHRDAFLGNRAWPHVFGNLFQGFATEVEKAEKLNHWYIESHAILVANKSLLGRFDLTTVDSDWLEAIAARADQLDSDITRLVNCESELQTILGVPIQGFQEARRNGWQEAMRSIETTHRTLARIVNIFGRHGDVSLSPARILELMDARLEIERARPEIEMLAWGVESLRSTGGFIFKTLLADNDARMGDLLERLGVLAIKIKPLVHLLCEHVDETETIDSATRYIENKHAVEQAISNLAVPGEEYSSQTGFLDFADGVAQTSRQVVDTFREHIHPDRSASDAFIAISKFSIAEDIISDISTSRDLISFFGPALKGYDTDCQAIADTYRWGAEIARLPLPKGHYRLLLSSEPIVRLAKGRSIHERIAQAHEAARAALLEMLQFGDFEIDDWIRQKAAPSDSLQRIELSLRSTGALLPLSRWLAARERKGPTNLDAFVGILEKSEAPAEAVGAIFELAAYQSIAKNICRAVPQISQFEGKSHTRLRDDFKALDRQIIALTGQACASKINSSAVVPEGTRGAVVAHLTDMHLLRREINKQKRHIPIRQLVTRAGRALQALKPCFMMGPLSVAQYLAQGTLKFDLVIMDEASQLRPEDALGAIARGSQLVVVGDPKQLPPTNFFDRMSDGTDDEDEDTTAVIQGLESILDICQQIFSPVRSLRWHYRSQHESLIAYSNHYFYKNLVVFPSPHLDNARLGVKWRFVKHGVYEERRNFPEAKHIADAVVWHMMTCPEESLGVVTLNGTQRDLVEELLEARFRENGACQAYMDSWESEGWPFFVKNLENVQGDERDCILISTTFGKPTGSTKVRQNFGPISRADGWRRLNVLFTRAKRRVELFTSMQPEDIILDEKTPLGTKALRDYLDFAKRGILTTTEETDRPPDSDFEISVAAALEAKGYEVRPQLGVAGYYLDLAVRNPDRPGEWLAAIECDGATYHSGLSVRDRDRIRQEILEALGWKGRIYRIWSTDWFYNPLQEVGKLTAFLANCMADSKRREREELVAFPWDDDVGNAPASVSESSVHSIVDADTQAIEALRELEAEAPYADRFVEVGDRVTYCFLDNPTAKMTVMIVDSESNPKLNIVNENTPIALGLLGLTPGEDGVLISPSQKERALRVLNIER